MCSDPWESSSSAPSSPECRRVVTSSPPALALHRARNQHRAALLTCLRAPSAPSGSISDTRSTSAPPSFSQGEFSKGDGITLEDQKHRVLIWTQEDGKSVRFFFLQEEGNDFPLCLPGYPIIKKFISFFYERFIFVFKRLNHTIHVGSIFIYLFFFTLTGFGTLQTSKLPSGSYHIHARWAPRKDLSGGGTGKRRSNSTPQRRLDKRIKQAFNTERTKESNQWGSQ